MNRQGGVEHQDILAELNQIRSVSGKIRTLHKAIRQHHAFLNRISVVLYDSATDLLRTFVWSSDEESPLTHYEARLADCSLLKQVAQSATPSVNNDLAPLTGSGKKHTQVVIDSGYRASYTFPMIWENHFFGFVFFNASEPNVFDEVVLSELDMLAHMITLLIYNERSNVRTLLATIKSALQMTHSKDPETGNHIERMSRYARIIAREVASVFKVDDDFVEHVFLFAPLHDIGKINIPDRILLKHGRLDAEEFKIMQTHSEQGKGLIDALLQNYGLNGVGMVQMLRNIALYHHEALDGSGYPLGLSGDQIPLEARIVTVADIFDALTSRRPYKEAWSNDEAFAELQRLAQNRLDPVCVAALIQNRQAVEQVQATFREDRLG
jgi:HD-GYP domain-containing protein (c-di-GMP phosphodiesterase class II)